VNKDLSANIAVCHNCRFHQLITPHLICTVDGVSVIEHAANGCPKDYYRLGLPVDAQPPAPPAMVSVVHGAIGLAKVALGIDRASDETQAARRAVCDDCPEGEKVMGVFHRCRICGCATTTKIALKGEKCPLGKW
jgi:hypothetical protein